MADQTEINAAIERLRARLKNPTPADRIALADEAALAAALAARGEAAAARPAPENAADSAAPELYALYKADLHAMATAVLYRGDFAAFERLAAGVPYDWAEDWREMLRSMAAAEIAAAEPSNLPLAALCCEILDIIDEAALRLETRDEATALARRVCAKIHAALR